jgi:NAD(P)H-hydrate epimerase
VADIGIGDGTIAALGSRLTANGPDAWIARFPRPALDAHKYQRGHALVLSGGALHTGAARMAARAACGSAPASSRWPRPRTLSPSTPPI